MGSGEWRECMGSRKCRECMWRGVGDGGMGCMEGMGNLGSG
jgi:hypothetical protein